MESRSTGNNHLHQSQVPNLHPQFGHYFHQFQGTQNPNTFHSLPHPQFTGCYYYPQTAADSSSSSLHPEYPTADSRNFAAIQQRGVDSNANVGAQVTLPADCKAYSANPYLYSGIASYPIPVINPLGNVIKKKQLKKLKALQYFGCEICSIDCNSKDLLNRHKLGKKHKKNLEKLRDPNASASLAMQVMLPADCKAYSANPYLYSGIASYPIPVINPLGNVIKKKQLKKLKVLQYFWCEICSLDCNGKEVLDRHKLGKKHKKNLEKLRDPSASASLAMVQQNLPLIGPQPCPNHGDVFSVENIVTTTADITVTAQKNRKKAACETPEDLEIKRRKVVDGGADSKAIRTCTICKVVCNSETVFRYHLMGQKHAAALRNSTAASFGTAVN